MTRSSKSRRKRARARKLAAKHANTSVNTLANTAQEQSILNLSKTDKRYIVAFALLSFFITAGYWWLGGRNLFVFPALFCISVGARRFWTGPVRHFADNA